VRVYLPLGVLGQNAPSARSAIDLRSGASETSTQCWLTSVVTCSTGLRRHATKESSEEDPPDRLEQMPDNAQIRKP
jgi:hypothetical protein